MPINLWILLAIVVICVVAVFWSRYSTTQQTKRRQLLDRAVTLSIEAGIVPQQTYFVSDLAQVARNIDNASFDPTGHPSGYLVHMGSSGAIEYARVPAMRSVRDKYDFTPYQQP